MTRKAYAKLNIFLKIVGKREGYHEILSRFVTCKELFDTMSFLPKETKNDTFELVGDFGCKTEQNTITKAFHALKKTNNHKKINSFFEQHFIHVKKNIPEFAGLGGGSSNAATFLLMCNEYLNLGLNKTQLAKIGVSVGADVPFFIYEYQSANVSGIGEIVEEFDEELLDFEVIIPAIKSSTKSVYEHFRENFFHLIYIDEFLGFSRCTSKVLLETFSPLYLNDLYKSATLLYPNLQKYSDKHWCMSGSGSSMFRIKNG